MLFQTSCRSGTYKRFLFAFLLIILSLAFSTGARLAMIKNQQVIGYCDLLTAFEKFRVMEANGEEFVTKNFFDQLNSISNIPMSLWHWELTDFDAHINAIIKK
ncbi:MAG: hypothetical protein AAFQ94_25960 [Bacteroidota bacterium]